MTLSQDRRWWLLIGLFTAVAFALRLIGAQESPAGDELYLYELVHNRSFGSMLNAVIHQEKTPPLGFALSWGAAHMPPADLWMRAPSVLAGTALVPVTALLARRVFGAPAALAAGAIVAVSPFLLFYGVEARAYSLAALLVTGSALAVLKATQPEARPRDWILFAVLAVSAALTHYTTVFALGAIVVWAFVSHPTARRQLGLAVGAAGLVFVAWVPSFLTQFGHASDEARRIADQAPLSAETLGRMLGRASIGHPFLGLAEIPRALAIGLILAGLLRAGIPALVALAKAGRPLPRPRPEVVLVFALAVVTLLGLVLSSLQPNRSLLLTRNLMASVPAWAILAGALTARPRWPVNLITTGAVVAGLGIGSYLELTQYQRPDMISAAQGIEQRWKPGDKVLEAAYATGPPLDRDLAIQLSGGPLAALQLTRNVGLKPFAQALKDGSSVFTVAPMAGYTVEPLGPPEGLKTRFRMVWSQRWQGLVDVVAAEWTPVRQPSR